MPHLPRQRLTLAIACAALSSTALAEGEKITVYGQSINADSVINQQQLNDYQAADLEDVFRQNPDISVGGSFGVAQKIYLRGIEDTSLNVSIDGATQSGYLFHHQGRIGVEPELLKRVEVQAGAGLASDGPGALGGAIRFITKDPEDLLRDGEQAGALVKLGYHSNTEATKVSTTAFGKLSEQVSVLATLSRLDGDNIQDGNGDELTNTATDQRNVLLKAVAKLDEQQTLRISHERREDDGSRNVRPHFISAGWNQTNEQESHRTTSNLQYQIEASDNLNLEANLYHTKAYISQDPSDAPRDGAGVKTIGFNLANTWKIDSHELELGTNLRRDTGYYINNPSTTINDDEVAKVYGVYLQDLWQVNEQLSVTAGVRWDSYKLNDNRGRNYSASGASPNLGVQYKLDENWQLRAGYAQAFRGPQVKEAYLLNFATFAEQLKAERADTNELGVDYDNGDFNASVTVFNAHIDNAVGRTSRSGYGNVGDVKNHGVTARLGYQWDNSEISAGYSYVRPELNGQPLHAGTMATGTALGDTLTLSFEQQLPSYNLSLGWSGRLVKRLSDSADRLGADKPGYGVHDVYARWLPTASEDLSLTLTVKNLFDKQYLDHGSFGTDTDDGTIIGLAEPGRDVRLTLSSRF